jgi:hypothetical protein
MPVADHEPTGMLTKNKIDSPLRSLARRLSGGVLLRH